MVTDTASTLSAHQAKTSCIAYLDILFILDCPLKSQDTLSVCSVFLFCVIFPMASNNMKVKTFNGPQLAKMKKSIPDMSLP